MADRVPSFALLGPLRVCDDAGHEVAIGGPKQRAVLATLVLEPNRVVSVDRIIDHVWGNDAVERAASTVQVYVHNLRRAVSAVPGADIVTRRPGYVLEVSTDLVDHSRFAQLVVDAAEERGRGRHDHALQLLDAALALWRGPALADLPDLEWVARAADRLEERRVAAVEQRNDAALAAGALDNLVGSIEQQLDEHPLREVLWAQLMVALYRAGRQPEALAAYSRVREVLSEGLGLDPGPDLRDLEAKVLRHDPALRAGTGRGCSTASAESAAAPPGLPDPLSALVGRRHELNALHALLDAGEPLITLVGPPGIGKTRLALEVARKRMNAGSRCAYVDLSTVEPGDEAVRVIKDAIRSLDRASDRTPPLLVIDGCEHVVHRVGALFARRHSTGLQVILTSQLPLTSPGELVYPIGPLPIPDGDYNGASGASGTVGAFLGDFDAVRLFEVRARAASPGFVVDAANAAQITRIVSILDGIPLAIELAAVQVRALSVAGLAHHLKGSLDFLVAAGAPANERHRTLRDAMAWSLNDLDEVARNVLQAVCCFVGEFTLDDALAVCVGADATLVRTIVQLVDRSLLSLAQAAGGTVRYRVLEPLRRIVVLEWDSGGAGDETGRRHADRFIALAAATGPLDREWQTTMDRIAENLAGALRFSIVNRNTAQAVRAAICLSTYYRRRGALERAQAALAGVLPMLPSIASSDAIDVLLASGSLAVDRGDCASALDAAAEVARRAGEEGDRLRQAHGLLIEAAARREMGEHETSRGRLELALEFFDSGADIKGTAAALGQLGMLERLEGNSELAAGLLEQGLVRLSSVRGGASGWTVADMLTHRRGRSLLLTEMGSAAASGGQLGRAAALFTESLLTSFAAEHRQAIASTLEAIAVLVAQRREPAAAATLLGAAESVVAREDREDMVAGDQSSRRPELSRVVAAIVADIGLSETRDRMRAGRRLSLDQAVRLGIQLAGAKGPTLTQNR